MKEFSCHKIELETLTRSNPQPDESIKTLAQEQYQRISVGDGRQYSRVTTQQRGRLTHHIAEIEGRCLSTPVSKQKVAAPILSHTAV